MWHAVGKHASPQDGRYTRVRRAGCALAVAGPRVATVLHFQHARLCEGGLQVGSRGALRLPAWCFSPRENKAQQGRGCISVAFILFCLLSPCPHARSVSALINVHSHTYTCTPSPFLLPACMPHTHTQSLVHRVWTPIASLLCVVHPPFATNPCPFHTKLPVGKTHNFYTTRS